MRKVNKRVIESLIKCGAFDSLGYKRRQLFLHYEGAMEEAQCKQKERESSQSSFFDQFDSSSPSTENGVKPYEIPDAHEWDQKELLSIEKEALGFYITGHPLLDFADRLKLVTNADSGNLSSKKDKDTVIVAGVVSSLAEKQTRRK